MAVKKEKAPGHFILRGLKEFWHFLLFLLRIDLGIKELFQKRNKLQKLPNRSGEVAVITGGSRGFGLHVVKQLLKSGFRVIIGDIESGENALAEIKEAGLGVENVEFLQLNLKSLKSVRIFATNVLNKTSRIDLLINNAGIMFSPFETTEDGFESQFQVNYLSHFLLTNLLLPKIKETAKKKEQFCRIVNTASLASIFTTLDPKRIGIWDEVYASNKAYNESKLCQVLYTKYLDVKLTEENARVHVYSLHPGIVPTRLWDNLLSPIKTVLSTFAKYYKTTEDGGNVIVFAALSPDLENKGGIFLDNCKPCKPNPQVNDFAIQKLLWDKSMEFTKS